MLLFQLFLLQQNLKHNGTTVCEIYNQKDCHEVIKISHANMLIAYFPNATHNRKQITLLKLAVRIASNHTLHSISESALRSYWR